MVTEITIVPRSDRTLEHDSETNQNHQGQPNQDTTMDA